MVNIDAVEKLEAWVVFFGLMWLLIEAAIAIRKK